MCGKIAGHIMISGSTLDERLPTNAPTPPPIVASSCFFTSALRVLVGNEQQVIVSLSIAIPFPTSAAANSSESSTQTRLSHFTAGGPTMNAEVTKTEQTPMPLNMLTADLESLVVITMTSSALNPGKAAAACCCSCCSSSCCCCSGRAAS